MRVGHPSRRLVWPGWSAEAGKGAAGFAAFIVTLAGADGRNKLVSEGKGGGES